MHVTTIGLDLAKNVFQIHGIYKDPYEQMAVGEKMGLGSREYELIDVLPLKEPVMGVIPYVPASPE